MHTVDDFKFCNKLVKFGPKPQTIINYSKIRKIETLNSVPAGLTHSFMLFVFADGREHKFKFATKEERNFVLAKFQEKRGFSSAA